MRVLLVWPNKEQFGSKPNSLSLLSAILRREGHTVRLLDTSFLDLGYADATTVGTRARIFKPVSYGGWDVRKRVYPLERLVAETLDGFLPDLLAVSALSDELPVGLRIAALGKAWRPELPVIFGNKAATLSPERVLASPDVDYLCRGEGIELLPELMRQLAEGGPATDLPNLGWRDAVGRPQLNPLRPSFRRLDELPFFDYSIYDPRQFLKPFDGRLYRGGDHMIAWGCPNHCSYCVNDQLRALGGEGERGFLRWYSVPRIVAELAQLAEAWDLELYKFHDEDFCLKPIRYLRQLAREYRRAVGLPFTAMANARNVTPERADLLAEMGCRSISLGFETGNEHLRTAILRRRESTEDLVRATKLLDQRGIRTSSFNMLGLPFETRATVMETIELNRRAGVASPNANFYFPYQGTELHRIAVENGFLDPSAEVVYRSDRPTLALPGIGARELQALHERFALYVKLPRELWPLIERSERDDEIGRSLTSALYLLYEETVLAAVDARWPASRDLAPDLAALRALEHGDERQRALSKEIEATWIETHADRC